MRQTRYASSANFVYSFVMHSTVVQLDQLISLFLCTLTDTDQQDSALSENHEKLGVDCKIQKRVTFSDELHLLSKAPDTHRHFFMMESNPGSSEQKPNFLVGGDENGYDEIEEKDIFPPEDMTGSLAKQLSDAALIDKRRRLR